jgi:hypothetical protein
MKKLRLQIEDLTVESFPTSSEVGPRGTVEAHGTQLGRTCGAVATCGPQTCGDLYCVIDTADPCGPAPTGISCPGPCAPVTELTACNQLSCAGCTTHDYTVNPAHDSCGFCMSFGSDVPQRCPCP